MSGLNYTLYVLIVSPYDENSNTELKQRCRNCKVGTEPNRRPKTALLAGYPDLLLTLLISRPSITNGNDVTKRAYSVDDVVNTLVCQELTINGRRQEDNEAVTKVNSEAAFGSLMNVMGVDHLIQHQLYRHRRRI